MSHSVTPPPPASGSAALPWRVLILDSSVDDPKWLLATVTLESDVRAAAMDRGSGRYRDWADVVEWVREQVTGSGQVSLVPISAVVWQVREARSG